MKSYGRDWAIELSNIAKKIYLIHRRDKFRCAPESMSKIHEIVKSGKIELVTPYQLFDLEGDEGYIKNVIVKDLNDNVKIISADYLLAFFGLSMNLGPISNWELNLNHNHIKVDPSTMQTNIKGIFAVGDIINYPGKLKLILSGFAEAAMATYAIYPIVHPNEALHFESSHRYIPI
ncbi:MAG: NAD(P)/FAD-dependent oxidoreductase [Rickettsiales bacterium]|nr:MAG: NAD(P)/FAD-dependent oxidoreductase [Rickettsiales bacterium]